MSDWQPADTAPTDGAEFLAFFPDGDPKIAVLRHETYGDVSYFGFSENLLGDVLGQAEGFTHWQPMPPNPEDAA